MGLSIHFYNKSENDVNVKVNHAGCAELPWEDGKPQCWWEKVEPGHGGVYVPSDWVTDFGTWIDMIVQGAIAIVVTVATAGTGTPEVVAAEAGIDAVGETADLTYEMSSEVIDEVAGEGASSAEGAEDLPEAVDQASRMSRLQNVAKSLGMKWRSLSKLTRGISVALGCEAIGIPTSVAFDKATSEWGFYYSEKNRLYKAKTTIQHDGNYYFFIGPEYKDLWEDVGLSA